jgi:hypothetical protein
MNQVLLKIEIVSGESVRITKHLLLKRSDPEESKQMLSCTKRLYTRAKLLAELREATASEIPNLEKTAPPCRP